MTSRSLSLAHVRPEACHSQRSHPTVHKQYKEVDNHLCLNTAARSTDSLARYCAIWPVFQVCVLGEDGVLSGGLRLGVGERDPLRHPVTAARAPCAAPLPAHTLQRPTSASCLPLKACRALLLRRSIQRVAVLRHVHTWLTRPMRALPATADNAFWTSIGHLGWGLASTAATVAPASRHAPWSSHSAPSTPSACQRHSPFHFQAAGFEEVPS